jgi:hypothetical protein
MKSEAKIEFSGRAHKKGSPDPTIGRATSYERASRERSQDMAIVASPQLSSNRIAERNTMVRAFILRGQIREEPRIASGGVTGLVEPELVVGLVLAITSRYIAF